MKKQLFLLLWSSVALFAQAPNISYPSGTLTYTVGTTMTPLSPTNKGGAVPVTIYGQVSTVGGEGCSAASFDYSRGITADKAGNVYVADSGSNIIRKITPMGVVTTIAGSKYSIGSADGTGSAASFSSPSGVTVDNSGNVYVADSGNNKIRKITPLGVVTTFAGSGGFGSADGTGAAASFSSPSGLTVDNSGNLYVADSSNNIIRKITPAGVVTTFAGSGYTGSNDSAGYRASFNIPTGLAVDSAGNVYVADTGNNKIRKITSAGVVTTLAGSGNAGSADGTRSAASFNSPKGVAVDQAGNVYVADADNNKIRKITPAGVVATLAGNDIAGLAEGTGIGKF
jgi:sugar lactone lactonase YvrE